MTLAASEAASPTHRCPRGRRLPPPPAAAASQPAETKMASTHQARAAAVLWRALRGSSVGGACGGCRGACLWGNAAWRLFLFIFSPLLQHMLFAHSTINSLFCVRNVIKVKQTAPALSPPPLTSRSEGPRCRRLLIFSTQESVVAKHNVVVFWGMKASHCSIPSF